MKTIQICGLFILLVLATAGRTVAAEAAARAPLSAAQMEELVSPIALYPDPLVALILPAATQPSDIVLAARYLKAGGGAEGAAGEPWDESVKSLTRYPEVVTYLDENLAWTRTLGECFLDQADGVMQAVQAVRGRARTAGLLKSTREQEVIVENTEVRIIPANPRVIYVPRYDPTFLYVSDFPTYYHGSFLTFGLGYPVGAWLSYDCDWRYRSVYVTHRPAYWYHQPNWRTRYAGPTVAWTRWVPSSRHDRRHHHTPRRSEIVLRPGRSWQASRPQRLTAPGALSLEPRRSTGVSGSHSNYFQPTTGTTYRPQSIPARPQRIDVPAVTRPVRTGPPHLQGPVRSPTFPSRPADLSSRYSHSGPGETSRYDHHRSSQNRTSPALASSTPTVRAAPSHHSRPSVNSTRPGNNSHRPGYRSREGGGHQRR